MLAANADPVPAKTFADSVIRRKNVASEVRKIAAQIRRKTEFHKDGCSGTASDAVRSFIGISSKSPNCSKLYYSSAQGFKRQARHPL